MESTFASRVRQYRQAKGLSQQALAEQCGLTQGNIAQMENGTEPKQSNVSKLLAGCRDLSPDWLLNGEGVMLRDGRALTPAAKSADAPAAQQPTEGLTSGPATVAEAENILLREQLDDKDRLINEKDRRLEDKDVIIEMLRTELGKPSGSSDAADDSDDEPNDPTTPTFSGGAAPKPMLRKRVGFAPSYITE